MIETNSIDTMLNVAESSFDTATGKIGARNAREELRLLVAERDVLAANLQAAEKKAARLERSLASAEQVIVELTKGIEEQPELVRARAALVESRDRAERRRRCIVEVRKVLADYEGKEW